MLIVISPAKTLDFETPAAIDVVTEPNLISDSEELAAVMKKQSAKQLGKLMSVSEKLAELNRERFQDWRASPSDEESKQAVFAFQGDVYQGMEADQLTKKQLMHAQEHLRILSGLYGLLRPLDRIMPYRLEMGTSLKTKRGKDLYAFWGSQITDALNNQIETLGSKYLLNLASNEYFKSIKPKELCCGVIAPVFKEYKNGDYKIISFFAKKARGTMASWVIRHKVKTPKKLTQFAEDGYRYNAESSTEAKPVFLRGGE